MAESMSECASDFIDDSIVKVKRLSRFKHGATIKFMTAVNSEQAWLVLEEIDFGFSGKDMHTPVELLDKTGKTLACVTIHGTICAATADYMGNLYVAQEGAVLQISKTGNVNVLIRNCRVSTSSPAMSCKKRGDEYTLMIWSGLEINIYDLHGNFLHKFNFRSPYKSFEIQRAFLHFDCIAFTSGQFGGVSGLHFYNMNGSSKSVVRLPVNIQKNVILTRLPYNYKGVSIIDVRSNPFFKGTQKGPNTSEKNPAERLLDWIVEANISISPLPFSRGFESSLWTLEDNTFTVFQCE